MKENHKQKEFLAYLDEAYNQPIGQLCERIDESRGNSMHPVLFSVLCDRVDLEEFEIERKHKIIKKNKKKEMCYRQRRSYK